MMITRRALTALAAAAIPGLGRAETYPARPARILVGFTPGGATDIQARQAAQWLSERLGQQFLVDNRPGASGNIATEMAARAAPDGYTLMQLVSPNAINQALFRNLPFDLLRDFAPVICMARLAYVVVVNPALPVRSIAELIALAKQAPDRLSYGSAGSGTPQNIAAELFKMMAGVRLLHVPYRGGALAVTDLLAGHVQVVFAPISEAIEQIKSGKLRALAVTTAARLDVLAEVPTVAESVAGYEASGFAGIGAPAGTPEPIVALLNRELNAGLADARYRARIVELGGTPLGGTPEAFGGLMRQAVAKWGRVIEFAGIRPD